MGEIYHNRHNPGGDTPATSFTHEKSWEAASLSKYTKDCVSYSCGYPPNWVSYSPFFREEKNHRALPSCYALVACFLWPAMRCFRACIWLVTAGSDHLGHVGDGCPASHNIHDSVWCVCVCLPGLDKLGERRGAMLTSWRNSRNMGCSNTEVSWFMNTMIYDFMIDRCGGNIRFMLMEGTYVFVFTLQEWTSQFTTISNNTMFVSVSLSLSLLSVYYCML